MTDSGIGQTLTDRDIEQSLTAVVSNAGQTLTVAVSNVGQVLTAVVSNVDQSRQHV